MDKDTFEAVRRGVLDDEQLTKAIIAYTSAGVALEGIPDEAYSLVRADVRRQLDILERMWDYRKR